MHMFSYARQYTIHTHTYTPTQMYVYKYIRFIGYTTYIFMHKNITFYKSVLFLIVLF